MRVDGVRRKQLRAAGESRCVGVAKGLKSCCESIVRIQDDAGGDADGDADAEAVEDADAEAVEDAEGDTVEDADGDSVEDADGVAVEDADGGC